MPRTGCCRRRRTSFSDDDGEEEEEEEDQGERLNIAKSRGTYSKSKLRSIWNSKTKLKRIKGKSKASKCFHSLSTPTKVLTMSDMDGVVNRLRKSFTGGKTLTTEFRQNQLRQLASMLEDHRQSWKDALNRDMGRCDFEAELCELVPIVAEAMTTHNELRDWMKPEKAKTGTINAMDTAQIQREPLGLCLIISSWNYPLQYMLTPLIGAIAAGNVAVIKASPKCPSTTDLMTRLFPKYLDSSCYAVVAGDADAGAKMIVDFAFDFIFFTGKTETGKAVMKAAAEHLTPVSLHLGGKNPVYVDSSCDVDKVARCIVWGKMMNAGQNCAAPDYVLCHSDVHDKFIEATKKVTRTFYGDDPKKSPHFGRIVDAEEWKRISQLIVKEKCVVGGLVDEETRYIAPTIMTNVTPSNACMASEIFGPVLPVLAVNSVEDALTFISTRPKPLAVYAFSTKNAVVTRFQESTTSGGFCGNDVLSHLSLATLPSSGVGASGLGPGYHGYFSFEAFSHRKSVLIKKLALEGTLSPRYPPFTEGHLNLARNALKKKFKGPNSNGTTNANANKKGEGDD